MTLTVAQIRAARRALAEYHRTGKLARGIRRCRATITPGWGGPRQCDLVAGHYPRTVHRHRDPRLPDAIEWPHRDVSDRP